MTPNHTSGRRWAYVGILLGGAVSIAANVAHSFVPPAGAPAGWAPNIGAVIGTVFWPVFVFIAIEIFARIAWPQRWHWAAVRFLGILPVAVVAAIVSYRHLRGLLLFYGEDAVTASLGPIAVDGLMVMATAALIATGHARITAAVPVSTDEPAAAPVEESVLTPTDITPAPATRPATVDVPVHLLPAARFAVVNHEQTTGETITPDELATRMNVAPDLARHLLDAIAEPEPVRHNGAVVTTHNR